MKGPVYDADGWSVFLFRIFGKGVPCRLWLRHYDCHKLETSWTVRGLAGCATFKSATNLEQSHYLMLWIFWTLWCLIIYNYILLKTNIHISHTVGTYAALYAVYTVLVQHTYIYIYTCIHILYMQLCGLLLGLNIRRFQLLSSQPCKKNPVLRWRCSRLATGWRKHCWCKTQLGHLFKGI